MLVLRRREGEALIIGRDIIRFLHIGPNLVDGTSTDVAGNVMTWRAVGPNRQGSRLLNIGRTNLFLKAFGSDGTIQVAVDAPRDVSVIREEVTEREPPSS